MARAARKNRFLSREKVERTFDTGYTRRCARCRESAKFAERALALVSKYLTHTVDQIRFGNQTLDVSELLSMVLLKKFTLVPDA